MSTNNHRFAVLAIAASCLGLIPACKSGSPPPPKQYARDQLLDAGSKATLKEVPTCWRRDPDHPSANAADDSNMRNVDLAMIGISLHHGRIDGGVPHPTEVRKAAEIVRSAWNDPDKLVVVIPASPNSGDTIERGESVDPDVGRLFKRRLEEAYGDAYKGYKFHYARTGQVPIILPNGQFAQTNSSSVITGKDWVIEDEDKDEAHRRDIPWPILHGTGTEALEFTALTPDGEGLRGPEGINFGDFVIRHGEHSLRILTLQTDAARTRVRMGQIDYVFAYGAQHPTEEPALIVGDFNGSNEPGYSTAQATSFEISWRQTCDFNGGERTAYENNLHHVSLIEIVRLQGPSRIVPTGFIWDEDGKAPCEESVAKLREALAAGAPLPSELPPCPGKSPYLNAYEALRHDRAPTALFRIADEPSRKQWVNAQVAQLCNDVSVPLNSREHCGACGKACPTSTECREQKCEAVVEVPRMRIPAQGLCHIPNDCGHGNGTGDWVLDRAKMFKKAADVDATRNKHPEYKSCFAISGCNVPECPDSPEAGQCEDESVKPMPGKSTGYRPIRQGVVQGDGKRHEIAVRGTATASSPGHPASIYFEVTGDPINTLWSHGNDGADLLRSELRQYEGPFCYRFQTTVLPPNERFQVRSVVLDGGTVTYKEVIVTPEGEDPCGVCNCPPDQVCRNGRCVCKQGMLCPDGVCRAKCDCPEDDKCCLEGKKQCTGYEGECFPRAKRCPCPENTQWCPRTGTCEENCIPRRRE